MKTSEQLDKIFKAIIAFQSEMETIKKTAKNPFFKSTYAPLTEVLTGINPHMKKHKLGFVQFPCGEHGLTTRVFHESGQWMEETYTMRPSKNDPQGIGSAIRISAVTPFVRPWG